MIKLGFFYFINGFAAAFYLEITLKRQTFNNVATIIETI